MTIGAVFANAHERRLLDAGEILFAAGDPGNQMFGVVSGEIELRRGEEVMATVGPEETFGELAIIDRAPRTLSAVATAPSEIVAIDQAQLLFLVHETPMFAIQVMRSLSHRIRDLDDRL